ncbi:DegT/DnrJ/EryC1/StrS family aminotransferase [candidate division KSB1 bacterium]|nr:DegT/DnrJ/EryC1/StrS family aminotransferase [candidate division KSB1 bacterium]
MDKKTIPFHRAWLGEEEEREVLETLRSGWLTAGERTKRFEEEFAKYVGARYAVGLNSCTAGLFLSLKTLEIGPGDEVITTPMTFTATANTILHHGAKPVFVDIRHKDLNIDVSKIGNALSAKTKAIVPVHFRGVPCDMDAITQIAKEHNLAVVEDAAHAVESVYKKKKIGSIGDTTCFSFYANKNITTGEGGMVTTDRVEIANRIRLLSNHGIDKNTLSRNSSDNLPIYDVVEPGYIFNMFDIQAAIGLHQLKKIDMFWEKRKQISTQYDEAFGDSPQVSILDDVKEGKNAYHIYVLLLNLDKISISRDNLLHKLKEEGIGVSLHFKALHLHSYYRKTFGYTEVDFPAASDVSMRTFSLPIYPGMKNNEVEKVIEVLLKKLKTHSK